MVVEADKLAHVRGQGAEAFPEFDSFPLFLRFGARFQTAILPPAAFEERPGGEALERDPRHEVHLAEAVSLEYVQRPAVPDRMVVILIPHSISYLIFGCLHEYSQLRGIFKTFSKVNINSCFSEADVTDIFGLNKKSPIRILTVDK